MNNNTRRSKKVKKKSSGLKKTIIGLLIVLLLVLTGGGIFLAKTYFDVKNVANKVSAPVEGRPEDNNIQDGEPFSVLL